VEGKGRKRKRAGGVAQVVERWPNKCDPELEHQYGRERERERREREHRAASPN
jgi:hypothetical protein